MFWRKIIIALVTFLFLIPVTASGSYTVFEYPSIPLFDENNANGSFNVFIERNGIWENIGKMSFDKYYRHKELDITDYANESKIRVKLRKQGGGMAHIDSILLNNKQPSKVINADILKKLIKDDFDVIDASDKEIEVEFNVQQKEKVRLGLTARIEGKIISEIPFQYPVSNLYKKIDNGAAFYKYNLNSNANSDRFFFKEYSVTGSGHPSGYTYGWLSNDDKNLYVKIDFTPDNTMDGEKDYAKVYIKTGEGIKEFKVSERNTDWGKSGFTYTDKVAYQHKVYEFKIPLKELNINDTKEATTLELAFSAYGTAAPPGGDFDTNLRKYLIAYSKNYDIYGQFVSENGAAIGSEFVICDATGHQQSASVAYNSNTNQYLVVWTDYRNGSNYDIYGQIVNANGTLSGSNFTISNNIDNQSEPNITYNSTTNQYLVVWTDYTSGFSLEVSEQITLVNPNIYGQIVNADGSLYGSNFAICNNAKSQKHPSVAYNSNTNQYLVAWTDYRNGSKPDIYGQIVNANSSLYGSNFVISNNPESQYAPGIAYNSNTNQYLVAWHDDRNTVDVDIYGQLINPNGSLSGTEFIISNATGNQFDTSVTYSENLDKYFVAWVDCRSEKYFIYGQFINPDGSLSGSNLFIVNVEVLSPPHVISNPYCPNFLVVFFDKEYEKYNWLLYGDPCKRNLTVTKDGTGTGSVEASGCSLSWSGNTGTCSADNNKLITLSSTADTGSTFDGWSGGTGSAGSCTGTGTCTFNLNSDSSVTAIFNRIAPICTYTINPVSSSAGYKGKKISVKVTATGENCSAPSISSAESWLTGQVKSFAKNRGIVIITVMANGSSTSRTGTVNIGGQTFTVTQSGAPCRIAKIVPTSAFFFNTGGEGSISVTAPDNCKWIAGTDSKTTWVTVNTGTSGIGAGTITYTVAPNSGGKNRAGKIIVTSIENSRKTHVIKQMK